MKYLEDSDLMYEFMILDMILDEINKKMILDISNKNNDLK